jgi:glycosyltransferase involved in cell wall biosynthesis
MRNFPMRGGEEKACRGVANELCSRGHNISVAYFEEVPQYENEWLPQIKIFKMPNMEEIFCDENVNFLKHIFQKQNIEICLNQRLRSFTKLCSKAKEGTKIKLISVLHLDLLPQNNSKDFKYYLEKFSIGLYSFIKQKVNLHRLNKAYDLSDLVVLLSNSFMKEWKYLSPHKRLDNVRIIPVPLIMKEECSEIQSKEKMLLFCSRMLEAHKRMSMAIKVWEKIYSRYPDWNLVFVGDGKDLQKTKELAKNLPRVQFEGFKKPEEYYKKSPIFLMTSVSEGLGMTLIEGQYFGCVPVAMNTYSSLHDIIVDSENGFISPDNIDDFAEKVCLLMDNAELREKMAKNGMESCKKFLIENITNEWEKLFEEFLEHGE